MRNLYYFFDNSRNYNYLLHNLLDLYYFWDLDHFLDDLFNEDWYLLDSVYNCWNLDYSFLNLLDNLRHFNIDINKLLYLNDLWLSDNVRLFNDNFLNMNRLYSWNNWFLDDKFLHNKYFLDNWYLDVLLYFFYDFFDYFNNLLLNSYHLFYHFLDYNLLMDYLHFFYFSNDVIYLLNNLNLLWNLDYSFSYLDYRNYLLYYSIYNLIFNFNVILNFSSATIFNYWNYFFYYLLNFDDLGDFDNSFNNFLNKDRHFNNLLNNLFNWNNLFLD